MSHRFSVGFALLVSLGMSGCSDPPRLNGVVQDTWGQAIEGATVQLDGLVDKQTTDARGRFSFPAQEGTMRLLAGKEGFIREIFQVEGSTDPESPMAEAQVKLFPD
ncbi:MAG: carboxypeptidase-like regulatory domain-containing protein, partial [Myxococcota bacterium]|nr:carboxypeptidase-like regulatory domain-containing protein [Myxococcota bacterium]